MFQISFTPEIKRRIDAGDIDEEFLLHAAQLIQPLTGKNFVRLNDEVKGVAKVRTNRAVEIGEPVCYEDMGNLELFDLPVSELDCGHFTIFWSGTGWRGAFDFRSGREQCLKMLDAARQFLEVAKQAAQQERERPCIDNLFSSCELVSKAELQLTRSQAANAKSHGTVKAALNKWGKLGNIDKNFLSLFNRLSTLRTTAKYDMTASHELPLKSEFELVERQITDLKLSVKHIYDEVG